MFINYFSLTLIIIASTLTFYNTKRLLIKKTIFILGGLFLIYSISPYSSYVISSIVLINYLFIKIKYNKIPSYIFLFIIFYVFKLHDQLLSYLISSNLYFLKFDFINFQIPIMISFTLIHLSLINNKTTNISFIDYLLNVFYIPSFFLSPHKLIGELSGYDYKKMKIGISFLLLGLFKKLVIADRLNFSYEEFYTNLDSHHSIFLIITLPLFYYFNLSALLNIMYGISNILGNSIEEGLFLSKNKNFSITGWKRVIPQTNYKQVFIFSILIFYIISPTLLSLGFSLIFASLIFIESKYQNRNEPVFKSLYLLIFTLFSYIALTPYTSLTYKKFFTTISNNFTSQKISSISPIMANEFIVLLTFLFLVIIFDYLRIYYNFLNIILFKSKWYFRWPLYLLVLVLLTFFTFNTRTPFSFRLIQI